MSFQPSGEEWVDKISSFIVHEVQSQVSDAFHDLRKELLERIVKERSKHVKSTKSNSSSEAVNDVHDAFNELLSQMESERSKRSKEVASKSDMNAKVLAVEKQSQIQSQIDEVEAKFKLLDQDFRRLVALLGYADIFQEAPKSNHAALAEWQNASKDIFQVPTRARQAAEAQLKGYELVVQDATPIGLEFTTTYSKHGQERYWMVKKIHQGSKAVGLVKIGDRLTDVNNSNISNCTDAQVNQMLQKRPLRLAFYAFRGHSSEKSSSEFAMLSV